MPKNRRDESWFYEASTRFFSSLLWATIIIVSGTVVVYLTTHVLQPNALNPAPNWGTFTPVSTEAGVY
jgi:hypothetical protein